MDDRDNYAVIGLIHYDALISELAVLRHENQRLQMALDNAVAKHMEIQERLGSEEIVEQWLSTYKDHPSPSASGNSKENPETNDL